MLALASPLSAYATEKWKKLSTPAPVINTAEANARSEAEVKVKIGDQVLSNTTQVDVKQGDINNQVITGPVHTNTNQEQAQSNTLTNVGSPIVSINNPKPLPPAPGVIVPNSAAPTLFNQYGLPANAKGMDLALRFMRACPSTYVKGVELREVREKGDSGLTNLIFTPHSNYVKYSNKGDVHMSQVVEIPDNAKVGEYRYLCLGLIQSEALAKNASDVPIQTVIGDAVRFSGDELRGFNKINLVLIPKEALSVNMGINADGKGFGVSPGASGMINAMLATLTGGFSMSSGYTFPAAQLGGTFIVVAEGDFPDAAPHIDFALAVPVISEEQKQLDAMRGQLEKARAEATAAKQAQAAAIVAKSKAEAEAVAAKQVQKRQAQRAKKVPWVKKSLAEDPCAHCIPKCVARCIHK